jgi:hypothetical protein
MIKALPELTAQTASRLSCYQLDPLSDPRWAKLLAAHRNASVFHAPQWLEALRATYGFVPVAFTTSSPDDELHNGLVFCSIKSWLTGQRLVSLPFSDHCEPLCDSPDELDFLLRCLQERVDRQRLKYVEFRPVNASMAETPAAAGFRSARRYILHRLDLEFSKDALFHHFDKDSIQRRIRRAERAQLREECGRSEKLLKDFYGLLVITRSRHHVPPQPYRWFQNLASAFGEALEIRLAYKGPTPVAAILTLRLERTVYYKYGCSDKKFNYLGAMPLLLWRAIEDAKSRNSLVFDMGRSDDDNAGLIAFKDKWGASSQPLVYFRFPGDPALAQGEEWKLRLVKRLFARMPDRLLEAAGNLIYRHIG